MDVQTPAGAGCGPGGRVRKRKKRKKEDGKSVGGGAILPVATCARANGAAAPGRDRARRGVRGSPVSRRRCAGSRSRWGAP